MRTLILAQPGREVSWGFQWGHSSRGVSRSAQPATHLPLWEVGGLVRIDLWLSLRVSDTDLEPGTDMGGLQEGFRSGWTLRRECTVSSMRTHALPEASRGSGH